MRTLIILGFFFYNACCFADPMKEILKDGKAFGKDRSKEVIEIFKDKKFEEEITKVTKNSKVEGANHDKTFDPENFREMLLQNQKPKSEIGDFILSPTVQANLSDKGFTDDEYFLKRGDEVLEASETGMEELEVLTEYEQVKCIESVDLIPLEVERELRVSVSSPLSKEVKICNGHRIKKHWNHSSMRKNIEEYRKFKKDLENNPLTKSVNFEGAHHYDHRSSVWYNLTHIDDAVCCDHFHTETREQENPEEDKDEWIYAEESFLSLIQSPDCMLVKQECLDADSSKIINGKTVKRSCWKERLSFLQSQKSNNDCEKLKSRKCDLMGRTCLKQGINGCALWELTYKCYNKLGSIVKITGNYSCLDQENWETTYEPNHSLLDVTTKLAVFEEIEREMEKGQSTAENIHIFDAKKMKCSKTIASNLIYDCCFSHKGLATQVGLAKCNSDELALADLREKGVCHYVGKYSETIIGVKTEDKHVYCCFDSKLARIINEEGRSQLGLNWGSAEHPKCKGFSLEELGRLDFSRLDLSEVFQDYDKSAITESLQGKTKDFENDIKTSEFENRLKTRMGQISNGE